QKEALTIVSRKHGWLYSEIDQTLCGKTSDGNKWVLKKDDEDLVWTVYGIVNHEWVAVSRRSNTIVLDYSSKAINWLLQISYGSADGEKLSMAREVLLGSADLLERYIVITTNPQAASRLLSREVDGILVEWPVTSYRKSLPEITLSTRSLIVKFESSF